MTDTPVPSPADEPTEAEIAAAGAIRPLDELPSNWTVKGDPPMLSAPTLSALSPADRQVVRERAGSDKPEAIEGALNNFLLEKQREARIRYGAGEGATETEREALDQMNQLRLLSEEHGRLETALAEVREHRTEYDADGNAVAVPVYALQGSLRSGREHRMVKIKEEMASIAGFQGEEALQRAARADALKSRELAQQVANVREINRRAHEMAREDRINEAARNKAKFLKGNLGF